MVDQERSGNHHPSVTLQGEILGRARRRGRELDLQRLVATWRSSETRRNAFAPGGWNAVHLVRNILESVKSGSSRVVAEAMSRLPDCITSMSEIVSDVTRGEEIWGRLPEDVVCEILRRLPTIRDVGRVRCVCRGWNSALSSPEFRHLWHLRLRSCLDIEQWMGSGSCELPEMRWTAVTHRQCGGKTVCAIDLEESGGGREIWIPLEDTVEVASSHGLICVYWNIEGRIVVGNHRSSKWKLLPPFPGNRKPETPTCISWAYSARFVRHDLLQQTYVLFFLEICVRSRQAVTHLYDSRTASWQRISRHPMPRDRFRSGIRDGSVVVVGYHYVNSIEGFMVEKRVEEVGMIAYDFCDNSWDEISTTLQHSSSGDDSNNSAAVEVEEGGGVDSICFRHRLKRMDGYRINCVYLCSNNVKDEYCRLVVVDGSAGVICLWQLDKESCTVFQLVSTVQLRPQRPWEAIQNQYDRASWASAAADASMGIHTWIIRSDATAFMAMVMYGGWSWLVIYDVGRLSWLTAHVYGYGYGYSLDCCVACCSRWELLERDVRWHDHGEVQQQQQLHDVKAVQGTTSAATAIRAIAADVPGRPPIRPRLHLVHAPDIWSYP